MKAKIISLSLLLITAIIWGFAFVAQVQGMDYIQPFTMIGVRFVICIVVLAPVVLYFERGRVDRAERKRTLIASILAGTALFSASALQQFGIQITESAGIAGFITGLYTVLVPVACYLLFKQKTGFNVWLGAILATVGLFLLCYKAGEGFSFGMGELLLLMGAMIWTAHVIIIDKLGRNVRSLHFAWGQFVWCAVLGLVCMVIFEQPQMSAIISAKWSILYLGVLSSGVAYTLQIVAQKRSDPTLAVIILSTESMFSVIGGVMFGIDKLTLLGVVGCVLMFAGIIVSQVTIKVKRKKENN